MTATVPPCPELAAPPHWRTVDFLSDLHLQASEPATWAAFRHYLRNTPADAVMLLGDVFEVWVGDDALQEPGSFEGEVANALHQASQQRALFLLHGNRDFLIGPTFAQYTGVQLLADPTVLVWHDQRILLSHGDALCLDDVDYQRFRLQARSPAWQSRFLAQPLSARRQQAQGIRAESEARKRSGEVYADLDTSATLQWLKAADAATLVHGHTHKPACHMLDDHGRRRWVLSDWDAAAHPPRGDVIRLTAQGLERIPVVPT